MAGGCEMAFAAGVDRGAAAAACAGEPDPEESGVVVLSFARYCRFRGIMKRLEGVSNKWLHNALVLALGGFAAPCRNTRVLFCKDTFDYPDLEGHEQLCNHLEN
ncbi:Uncharacterized protein GBIM_13432 [Gryllus bimaculatus]|nr:Uncharacterized protein GBIM_13432 [Gryllus bimaculatus]